MTTKNIRNNTMPVALVSIIIPVYNAGTYLHTAINSALEQTWEHTEIILVDDGSTDSSLQIIKSYGDKVILCQQQNKGASSARNLGLKLAKGNFIQFLDADDMLSPDKIENQVNALKDTIGKVAVCHTVYFNNEAARLNTPPSTEEEKFVFTTDDVVDFMIRLWGGYNFKAWMVQTNAWLIPRELIDEFGGWNESLSLDDDGEFFARMVLNSKGIVKTGGINYYRKYPPEKNNLSAQKTQVALESHFKSTLLKREYLFGKTQSEVAKKAIYNLLNGLSITSYLIQPGLYKKINAELLKLPRYKYKVIIGGYLINLIANLLDWRLAKRLQRLYTN